MRIVIFLRGAASHIDAKGSAFVRTDQTCKEYIDDLNYNRKKESYF